MLLVIDMQPRFHATEAIINEVIVEVKRAVARNEWIIFLTVGQGRTAYRITQHVRGYRHKRALTKYNNDGAGELFGALIRRSRHLNANNIGRIQSIKVCGVNTGACVYSTVKSLSYLDVEIKVLSHAVAQCRDGYSFAYNKSVHFNSLRAMRRLSNVTVI